MKLIEIDGAKEAVWRCQALVSWQTAGVFPFSGGDWAESLRRDSPAPDPLPRDHQLEILLTEDVLLCSTGATAVAPAVVGAIDTANGFIRTKAGATVSARISRRAHLAAEAEFVQGERLIAALGQKKKRRNVRRPAPRSHAPKVCAVCGWGHDAGFAQIVALVHEAQAAGAGPVSTKDERLLTICGGYRHPCKVFDDLGKREVYQVLFDTRRRGFLGLRRN